MGTSGVTRPWFPWRLVRAVEEYLAAIPADRGVCLGVGENLCTRQFALADLAGGKSPCCGADWIRGEGPTRAAAEPAPHTARAPK